MPEIEYEKGRNANSSSKARSYEQSSYYAGLNGEACRPSHQDRSRNSNEARK